jgi:hypothetical protein
MEQLNYNLLFRWFVGLSPDDPVWDATSFSKNRDRLQGRDVFRKFMDKLLNHAKVKTLLSDKHCVSWRQLEHHCCGRIPCRSAAFSGRFLQTQYPVIRGSQTRRPAYVRE